MTDSAFSLPFYLLGAVQVLLFCLGASRGVREAAWYRAATGMALLALPALLGLGFYYAIQPVA
ncbi:hypothetical protein [Janthinobacterium sp.]|uniref:hypothetical protein n=1 Tax=Janthinobacterium sp. TaxID=1871054 RepID=UPI00293D6188|nr:hypothetical protein [Janthinobacterium sp.]